ncbi:diguanylate cyclase [Undibacterium sp. Di26W]|uniref:ligand-binding sensor domain-containing diguanylate cyclase n=1 Tax=Undibacterium sp. Di26W TaxID=3413035 RepID=UPI003BF2756C
MLFNPRIFIISLILWPFVTLAQQMPLQYYTQHDGLSNLSISTMAFDQTGYLWIGTENGLFRYNGAGFRRFSQENGLTEPFVTAIHTDPQDRLWVGSYDNLYLKSGERFLPVLNAGKKMNIWPGQNFASLANGSLLVIGDKRLYSLTLHDGTPQIHPFFSDEQIRQQPVLGDIASIHADTNGTLWMGCSQSLCQYDPQGLKVWSSAHGVPVEKWSNIIRDHKAQLWARGSQHIVLLRLQELRFVDRTPPGNILNKIGLVNSLTVDSENRVLSNTNQGLIRWDKDHWEVFDARNGLRTGGGLNALLFDREGSMWLGARGHGLINWLGYGNWENWTTAQGVPDDVVLSFLRDQTGMLHIGTRSGPASMRQHERHFVPDKSKPDYNKHQWARLVSDKDGVVWGSTYSGLLMRYDAGTGFAIQVATLPLISGMLADHNGGLWLATEKGVFTVDTSSPGSLVRQPAELEAIPVPKNEPFVDLCQNANGDIWFLSEHRLLRFNGKHWDSFRVGTEGDGAAMGMISCAGDGSLWLGSDQAGLWRVEIGKNGIQASRQEVPLLRGKIMISLHEDSRGWLWAGTDAGIAVWNKKLWRFFNQNHGLVWDDINGHAFYEDKDGSMWIATSNGMSHLLQPERLFTSHQLNVLIESVTQDGKFSPKNKSLHLAWSPEPVELTLASLSFQNRAALKFHYRLAGLEKNWSESFRPDIRYTALPPGSYQLEYFVSNVEAQTVSPLMAQALLIQPPWWRTTPFYFVCGLAAVFFLLTLHRYRLRKLTRRQLQMEALVSERTRELELSREELRVRALRDGLTKAWNRSALIEILDKELIKASRQQTPLLLILLDLDHFKRINDTYGHPAGDTVLQEVVLRLETVVRQYDAVGRYGGEEFLVLLIDLDLEKGRGRVEALHQIIQSKPIQLQGHPAITVTASFGVSAFDPQHPKTSSELIAQADMALYRSKEQGRNRIEYIDSENRHAPVDH